MTETDLIWLEPQSPKEIMEELIDDYKIEKFYPLYSGGQDSGAVGLYCIENYPEMIGSFVFTCTGIGSPMTRNFAVDYIENQLGFNLDFTWARKSYYDVVVKERHAFPSAGSHRIIMGYLKFHSWYYYMKPKLQRGEKAAFISGVRKSESMVRNKKSFYTKKPIDINATLTFAKPYLWKNGSQIQELFIKNGGKKSKAYDYFNKSGECWCGCFYNDWELKMLEKYDPFLFQTIRWLESQVQKEIIQIKKEIIPLETIQKDKKPSIFNWDNSNQPTVNEKLTKLRKQLFDMETHSKWGGSVGADYSINQTTLDTFDDTVKVNEDYCGESCGVGDQI